MSDDTDDCAFRILGPIHVVTVAGPVTFARRQQQDLLALLLLRAGHVMSVSHIVDAMWGEDAPRTATTQIKNMMSGLRTALAGGPQPSATVDWQPAGYRIRLHRGQLDLARFNSLVAMARDARPADAVPLLRRAIGLWRGPCALAGVRANFADAARAYLEEQRNGALEALFAAELETANHTKIIAELTDAVAQHPTREHLVAQLMTALHRSGRTSDALGTYRRARRILAEEHGLEPGSLLQDLERHILLGDPALNVPVVLRPPDELPERPVVTATPPQRRAAPGLPPSRRHHLLVTSPSTTNRRPPRSWSRTVAPGAPVLPVPSQLPLDVRGFAGRASEIAQLDTLLDTVDQPRTVVISALMGGAGVGKTALAVHWAHRVAHRFPGGQLYVNLRGFEPAATPMSSAEAVRGFLDAFAVAPERLPSGVHAQAALYRSLVAGRRMLVLLDNAVDAEQVRPLLPGAPGCLVLVTSRNRLTSLVAMEGAHPVTLDMLTDAEARELLVARLGVHRVRSDEPAVECLAGRCARLPLALAMVAARAAIHPALPLRTLAAELADARTLSVLAGTASGADLRAVFSWSYERLGLDAARLFRWLGLHPGPQVAVPAVASLAGEPIEAVRALLAELTDAHLLVERNPGRFAMHDLLRAYATELCAAIDPAPARAAAERRLLDHYLHTADLAARRLHPHKYQVALPPAEPGVTIEEPGDRDQALAWFTAEHRILVAAVALAAAADLSRHAWQLATTIGIFVDRQGRWDDWISASRHALATTRRRNDLVGQAHAHSGLGVALGRLWQFEDAYEHLERAAAHFADLDDRLGSAYTQLRLSSVCDGLGRQTDALAHAQGARRLFDAAGHRAGLAQALNTIGWHHAKLGDHLAAIGHCEQAVTLHRELGDQQGAAHTLDSLGYAYHQLGDFERAARYCQESARMLWDSGDWSHAAFALSHLGDAHDAAGDHDRAHDAWGEAHRVFAELGHPEVDRISAKLRSV